MQVAKQEAVKMVDRMKISHPGVDGLLGEFKVVFTAELRTMSNVQMYS